MVVAALVLAGCRQEAEQRPHQVTVRRTVAESPAAPAEQVAPDVEPAVEIMAEPKSGKAPITVKFRAKAVGLDGPLSYDWSFGDGGESTAAEPPPRRYATGKYNVILKVTDARGKTYRASVTVDSECPGC